MLKLTNYAVTMALLTHTPRANAKVSTCGADGLPISTIEGTCNYANFKAGLSPACDITLLFPPDPATGKHTGEADIADLCEYDAPTQFVEIQGTYQRDRRYFAGGGNLVDGADWALDSARIKRFHMNTAGGSNTLIAFPEYLARVDYHTAPNAEVNEKGYGPNMNLDTSCDLKTIMCCFTDDSAGSSFSAHGDATTDVCRHDLRLSPESNHIKEGWSVFPGSETSTQCVGFTWEDGDEDLIGNLMYDVSLRQTALHGYRGGVPGAPLCGCVEHMPEVASAQCRTASKTGDVTFEFRLDDGEVSASNEAVIEYNDCGTDLATAYKANHANDEDKALIDEYLVGDCAADLTEYLNDEQFLHESQDAARYITPDPAKWSDIVVGEGIYFHPPPVDPPVADAAFRALIEAECGDGADRHCIVRRTCTSCRYDSHKDIYYKRLTALPPNVDETDGVYLLDMFMNNWSDRIANTLNVDFELYSSYEDAIAGTSRWTYCNYNDPGIGLPRDCGPTGHVGNQWNAYVRANPPGDANHHAFYVEKPMPATGRKLR